jgi:hypothetical protein
MEVGEKRWGEGKEATKKKSWWQSITPIVGHFYKGKFSLLIVFVIL